MKELTFRTKRFLIQKLEPGKEAGHPVYVEKSVLKQIWEDYGKPAFFIGIGLFLGWLIL